MALARRYATGMADGVLLSRVVLICAILLRLRL